MTKHTDAQARALRQLGEGIRPVGFGPIVGLGPISNLEHHISGDEVLVSLSRVGSADTELWRIARDGTARRI